MLLKGIDEAIKESQFSGVVVMKDQSGQAFELCEGYANRSDEILNTVHTRFGIASGCKLFTAIAICQLVERDQLSFDTKLRDCLDIDFPNFSESVTVHDLLTHTSGIPDYFDEKVMEDYEDLWKQTPMYLVKQLRDFLPMFRYGEMMFEPGERFHYNNAGFIVLGLIIEHVSGISFTEYVVENIFKRIGMDDSGYFSMDRLPKHTAIGYIDGKDGTWRTNTYSLPIQGGADGGAYVTAPDMIRFWEALVNGQVLNEGMTRKLLTPHFEVKEGVHYGYGVWINTKDDGSIFKYHVMGYDPGVSFHSAYYPESDVKVAIPSNKSEGAFAVMKAVEESIRENVL